MKLSKVALPLIASLFVLPMTSYSAGASSMVASSAQAAAGMQSDRVDGHPYLVPAAVSLFAPAGFAADQNTIFATAGVVNQWPGTDKADGYFVTGYGFGNGEKTVGVTASVLIDSLGINHSFANNGGGALQVFKWLTPNLSISAGAANLVGWGAFSNAAESYFLSGTQTMSLIHTQRVDIPLALTVGAGSGAFDSPHSFVNNKDDRFGPFASAALGIFNRTNLIVDYTSRFLSTGVSFMPFRTIPLGFTVYASNLAPSGASTPKSVSYGARVSAGYRFA